jgi:hypothetical protein
MIKYPVKVVTIVSREDIKKMKGVETYRIVDSVGKAVATSHNESEAKTIVRALNAMYEFPAVRTRIKYPVKRQSLNNVPYYTNIVDADNNLLCTAVNTPPDLADTIINALNAMNEFPSNAVGSSWVTGVIESWFGKFFPNYSIHHTKKRDCLCEECADT